MRIYLAARYGRRDEIAGYRAELRRLGHNVVSAWLDEGDDGLEHDRRHAAGEIDPQAALEFASVALAEIYVCDLMIAFTEHPSNPYGRGGRHVELGFALGQGKRVFVVGHKENVFTYLPDLEFYPTWEEAKAAL